MTPEASLSGDLRVLDAMALRRWALLVLARLEEHREAIDALNVFPVPDGDTGSNLYRTWAGALHDTAARDPRRPPATVGTPGAGSPPPVGEEPAPQAGSQPSQGQPPESPAEQVAALAHAALLCARGNSGVLLGQLLQGLALGLTESESGRSETTGTATGPGGGARTTTTTRAVIGPAQLAHAFTLADERAWAGVSDPVEGTILSVSRLAAQAAQAAADHGGPLAEVTGAALGGAQRALAATPAQLPSLARAGVVDAGGAGLVVILAALHEVVTAERMRVPIPTPLHRDADRAVQVPTLEGGVGYEVMYVVQIPATEPLTPRSAPGQTLAARLDGIGDSVVVGGHGRHLTVHVHTTDPGRAVELGLAAGELRDIRIEVLHRNERPPEPLPGIDADDVRSVSTGGSRELDVVVCAGGVGLARLFAQAGACVVPDSPGARATPAAILTAICTGRAERVVVLANDRDTRMAAHAAADLAALQGRRAQVLPSDSPVQAVAAMAVYDPDADPERTIHAMTQAAGAVRAGRVTLATRRARTDAGWCEPGDALGIVADDVLAQGPDRVTVALAVVRALAASEAGVEPELVTLVCGEGADDLADALRAAVSSAFAHLDVTVIHGDQPVYTVLVGVE